MRRLCTIAFASLAAGICAAGESAPSKVIDAHAHLGRFRGYDLSLPTLRRYLDRLGAERAVVSNIDAAALPGATADAGEIDANEALARAAAGDPRLVPIAWAKPGAPGASAAAIEPFLRDRGFRGIKLHPDFNGFVADGPEAIPYLKLCEKYRVPAVFHCGGSPGSSAAAIHRAARRFPTVPFVLYHMGFGTDHAAAISEAAAAAKSGDALLYLETAQVDPAAVARAIRTVGAARVLFGTDATYYGAQHYEAYAPLLDALRALPVDERRLVLHDNAARLFGLGPAAVDRGARAR